MERVLPRMASHARRPGRAGIAHVGVVTRLSTQRMPNADEINQWMRSVATASDRLAFAALFRHFGPRLKSYLMRSGSSEAQAEELVQDTMVVLWRRAASFDPAKAQLSTWLFTIARNARISDHRRRATAGATSASTDTFDVYDADLQPADPQLGPEELLLAVQRERSVRRAMDALPPDQGIVLRRSFFEEQPHAQIAQELGIPLGTVKSRIRLAVAQLRRLLDGLES